MYEDPDCLNLPMITNFKLLKVVFLYYQAGGSLGKKRTKFYYYLSYCIKSFDMKIFVTRLALVFLILLPVLCKGQDSLLYNVFPLIKGKVNYTKIFEIDSAKKDQLFTKIKDWAVNSYVSQQATLQAEDKEAGYIAYKGYLPVTLHYTAGILKGKPYQVDVYHTLTFYIKDGKVKIVFTDLETVS